jgi:hypothetical protein
MARLRPLNPLPRERRGFLAHAAPPLDERTSLTRSTPAGISTPAFRSTDASSTYNARGSSGTLPATTFLTTGSTSIGATMN